MLQATYADAQALVITFLREQLALRPEASLDNIVVAAGVPPTRPSTSEYPLLVVRRSGGLITWPAVDRSRLDFLIWHHAPALAMEVANIVRATMLHQLPGRVIDGHTMYRPSEFAGPIYYPDPAGSGQQVLMFTMQVPIRCT